MPERICVPAPTLTSPPEPLSAPEKLFVALLDTVSVALPKVTVPAPLIPSTVSLMLLKSKVAPLETTTAESAAMLPLPESRATPVPTIVSPV